MGNKIKNDVTLSGDADDSYNIDNGSFSENGENYYFISANPDKLTGKFAETNQPAQVTLTYAENKQSITGSNYTMYLGDKEATVSDFDASATDKEGNAIDVSADFSGIDFSKTGSHDIILKTADGQSKTVILTIKDRETTVVPIFRAYNPNDGDHLYTASQKEYDWITGLKWNAEGIAFQSVLSDYENAIAVYRLYNSNSGEHFYTTSEKEYDWVASKGWTKEQVSFYMVPKEKGNAVYRVFNPNATGPGSHLFTSSKEESTWLINQGWTDEGIAFYSAK